MVGRELNMWRRSSVASSVRSMSLDFLFLEIGEIFFFFSVLICLFS